MISVRKLGPTHPLEALHLSTFNEVLTPHTQSRAYRSAVPESYLSMQLLRKTWFPLFQEIRKYVTILNYP